MKKPICVLLAILIAVIPTLEAVSKHNAMYLGGTASRIPDKAVGVISTDDPKTMGFHWDGVMGFGTLTIPFEKITRVSYSQHIGRGVGSSVALGVTTLGVGVVPMLLSKKRRHFVEIEFAGAQGAEQRALFEVGKDEIHPLLSSIEARSGKKIVYQDEEEQKTASKSRAESE